MSTQFILTIKEEILYKFLKIESQKTDFLKASLFSAEI